MANEHRKAEINDMIRRHQESVKKQNEIYQKNLEEKIKRSPAGPKIVSIGAGLESDDMSKVASIDKIGGSTEDLKK